MPMTSAVANQMLVSACNCHLELIMSVHVRHRRFDTLLYALRSYAPLPLEHVYLYFELDAQLANRSVELKTAAEQLFGSRLAKFSNTRRLVISMPSGFSLKVSTTLRLLSLIFLRSFCYGNGGCA